MANLAFSARRKVHGSRRVALKKVPVELPLPTTPGKYLWTEWDKVVELKKPARKGGKLWFDFGGHRLRISPRIAGSFISQDVLHGTDT